jgi:hypothetical protein
MDANVRSVRPKPPKILSKASTADASFLVWLREEEPSVVMMAAKKKNLAGITSEARQEVYTKQIAEHQNY